MCQEHKALAHKDGGCDLNPGDHGVTLGATTDMPRKPQAVGVHSRRRRP